ncbi:MAG: CDP-alcohol phosphatidyltransferase family protein [Myxococcales bacterium]|nr:CDP-alcohol phosphatidyltransferase family protein [Myxococcales bacterium]
MFGTTKDIYVATRKKHDLLFNTYVMRPLAAVFVALLARTSATPNQVTLFCLVVFVGGVSVLVGVPTPMGAVAAVAVLELSYCFDCVDGMLARHKKIASKTGHYFDFFTDELKATLLAAALAVRLFRTGGLGVDGATWPAGSSGFLLAGVAGTLVVASAISLTTFVRRPEVSGRESTVEAFYETVDEAKPKSLVGRVAGLAMTFLRFLNHYPSHIWLFALLGRLDVFFWMYVALNALYLARGWLGLFVRFGLRRE